MLLSKAVVAFSLVLFSSVRAQNSTQILEKAAKDLPPCALKCMLTSISKSSCSLSDVYCIAKNEELNDGLEICVKSNCTIKESLTAKNFSESTFGGPPRDHTKLVSHIGLIPGCFALVAVVLRIYSRLPCCGGTWGPDDWAILATMLPTIPLTCLSVVLAHDGLGKDMWTVPFKNITRILHIYYFDEIFYISAIALTKISILLFYLRIFPNRLFRRWTWATIAVCGLYLVGFLPAIIFQCIPIRMAWDRWDGEHKGRCVNLNTEAWTAAAINIVLDLVVICLPLRELTQLKMSRPRKAGILFMFLGGGFVTVVSAIRLQWMIQFANTENVTWDYTPVGYWSTLEVHVGIIIACLPALRSLQHRLFPSFKTPASYYNGPSGGYGYNTKGSSPFPSIAKFKKRESKNVTTASQSSMMRSRADKEFIQLDDYEIRLDPDVENNGIGRGFNNTHIERCSTHTEDATFLDTSSIHGGPTSGYFARPNDAITVKKEYSVNIEMAPDLVSSSTAKLNEERRSLSVLGRRSSSLRRDG